jgi:hypothetical protein
MYHCASISSSRKNALVPVQVLPGQLVASAIVEPEGAIIIKRNV